MTNMACNNCEYWNTNEVLQKRHGEGEGQCELLGEVTFCVKHNCFGFKAKAIDKESGE